MSTNRFVHATALAAIALTIGATAVSCAAQEGATEEKVTDLTIWGFTPTDSVSAALDAYEEESGVKVDYTVIPAPFESTLLAKWATGERPDILMGQPNAAFLRKLQAPTTLADLSDMDFVSEQKYNLGKTGELDGTVYSATFGFPTMFGALYNKAVFEDLGVDVPSTYDELLDAAQQLKDGGVTPIGLSGGDPWTLQMPLFGELVDPLADGFLQDVNDHEATFEDAPYVDAVSRMVDLTSQGLTNDDFLTLTYAELAQEFEAGKIGMVPQGSWIVDMLTGDLSNYSFIPFPSDSGAVLKQSGNATAMQVPLTGNTARENAARDLVQYMTVGDGYKTYLDAQAEPSILAGVDDPAEVNPITAEAAALLDSAVPSVDSQTLVSMGDVATLLSQALDGSITPAEVGAQVQRAYTENAQLAGIEGW
ncbi:MAG: ABC transporter substrate-binding protein [Humibacter sp.]